MKLISEERLALERLAHTRVGPCGPHQLDGYGVSGYRWADDVLVLLERVGGATVLDYGAGKGTLGKRLRGLGLDARDYDPVTFPTTPEPADVVVVTDVLEFVEPELLDNVLDHVRGLAREAVFVAVPRHPDHKALDGRLTRYPLDWWRDRLSLIWPKHEAQLVVFSGGYVNAPRKLDPRKTPRLRFIGYA